MKTIILIFSLVMMFACSSKKSNLTADNSKSIFCDESCEAKSGSKELACKLTSPELQQRKATVLASLRKQMTDKKELENGYAFKFAGSDSMLDELTSFIKTERECCDFFTFNISISGDKKEIWLSLSGPKEAKEFIKTEMEL